MNDSLFLRVKKQPEIDKNRVDNKENKKIADISKCLLRYMREYKPSNSAAKDYNPQTDKRYISTLYAGFDSIPLIS